jgi:outer membrane protein TolC
MKAETRLILISLALFFANISLSVATAGAQDTVPGKMLSFDQALQLTWQNSHVLKQSKFSEKEKNQAAKASKGLYFPKVGISANYIIMQKDISLDLTPVRDALVPLYEYGKFTGIPSSATTVLTDDQSTAYMHTTGLANLLAGDWDPVIQKKQFGTVAATASWPIFTGGKIYAANHAASIEVNEASEVTRQKEGELESELVERYFGLCLAKQAVKVREDVYKGLSQHLDDAEKMQKEGLIANADVLHAKVYFSQADRELKKAMRTVITINQALVNTLALDHDTAIEPVSGLFYIDSIEPVEHFKSLAADKNPLLLQVEDKRLLAKQNYNVQRSDYLPSIAIEGMYDILNKDLSEYTPDWMVGIGMKWTLFDGASRYRKVKVASVKSEEVQEFKEKAQSDVATMIDKLYQELNMYREQLLELESAQNFAEEYLRVREKAFQEETSNSTEVVDARLALAQVQIERLQAMYGFDLTLARMLQYSGIPEEFSAYSQRTSVKTESYKPMK